MSDGVLQCPSVFSTIFYNFLNLSLLQDIQYDTGEILLKHHPSFSQPAITCLKLTIETLEQGVKYVQS